jgi:tetratricopeptide (TPR) repeat protein
VDGAIRSYREAIRLDPSLAEAHNNLGNVLLDKGGVDGAIRCYREAIRLDPSLAVAHSNLGNALRENGEVDGAIRSCREAIRLNPSLAQAHLNLGEALILRGDFAKARNSFQQALDLLSQTNARAPSIDSRLAECQRLLELEQTLDAVRAGKHTPKDPGERLDLAEVAQLPAIQLYNTAVRLYTEAFREQPGVADDLRSSYRYNAACAASCASTGLGKDGDTLDDAARAHLRNAALSWMHDDLKAHTRQLAESPAAAAQSQAALAHWRTDPDLSGLRDPAALGELPLGEQAAWVLLWAEVDALLARSKPGVTGNKPAAPPQPAPRR